MRREMVERGGLFFELLFLWWLMSLSVYHYHLLFVSGLPPLLPESVCICSGLPVEEKEGEGGGGSGGGGERGET